MRSEPEDLSVARVFKSESVPSSQAQARERESAVCWFSSPRGSVLARGSSRRRPRARVGCSVSRSSRHALSTPRRIAPDKTQRSITTAVLSGAMARPMGGDTRARAGAGTIRWGGGHRRGGSWRGKLALIVMMMMCFLVPTGASSLDPRAPSRDARRASSLA